MHLLDHRVTAADLVRWLGRTYGFHSARDLVGALRETEDDDAANVVELAIADALEGEPGLDPSQFFTPGLKTTVAAQRRRELAEATNFADAVLATIPDSWFAEAVGLGTESAVNVSDSVFAADARSLVVSGIEDLFERTGVPYHFNNELRLERIGEPIAAAHAVQPAMSALDDARLGEAKRHFGKALQGFRRDEWRLAVDESRLAIEAALVAFVEESGGTLPNKHQANELFSAARDSGLPRQAEEIVLGAPRLRNRTSAGHAGKPEPDVVDAEACLAAASAGLLYVAHRLRGN